MTSNHSPSMAMSDGKQKPEQMPADEKSRSEYKRRDSALDEALKDSFPASDPVSAVRSPVRKPRS